MSTDGCRSVLLLIPTLTGGGAERVVVTLLRHLDRSKFRLTLAVVDIRKAVFQDDIPEDVEFINLGCSRVRYALPSIIRLIWERKPAVVFSTLGHLNLALAIVRPLLPDGVRYIGRESSIVSETLRCYPLPRWWRWAYRRFYHRFDTVVCQSRYMRDDLVENFGFPATKAVVIHNPTDFERIHHLAREPFPIKLEHEEGENLGPAVRLVAAGRLSYTKGYDILIEALSLCNDPRLHLTLLGEGPLRNDLKRLAQEKGVAHQIRFAGFQKNPYPFFAQADAFVLSSRFEGLPNVVLEALACGTPVIATPAPGGVKEILEGVEGCVVADSVTAEALAKGIDHWKAISRRPLAMDVVAPFSVQNIIRQYQSMFLE